MSLISCVGLTFFAYAGFGTMANAAGSVPQTRSEQFRAPSTSRSDVVIVLYVGLAVIVLSSLYIQQS